MMGDIGGFFSFTRLIGKLMVYYLGFFDYETFVISRVFKKNDKKTQTNGELTKTYLEGKDL